MSGICVSLTVGEEGTEGEVTDPEDDPGFDKEVGGHKRELFEDGAGSTGRESVRNTTRGDTAAESCIGVVGAGVTIESRDGLGWGMAGLGASEFAQLWDFESGIDTKGPLLSTSTRSPGIE